MHDDSLLDVVRDTLRALDTLEQRLPTPERVAAVSKLDVRTMFYRGTLAGITGMLSVARDQLRKQEQELGGDHA